MPESYTPPEFNKKAFNCPYCNAYAAMNWESLDSRWLGDNPIKVAECHRCKKMSIWLEGTLKYPLELIYPRQMTAPLPNEDIPEDCKPDYLEARAIANDSPRGAAALLRLCIQKLT